MYIITKRIRLIAGDDPLKVDKKYGKEGIVLLHKYYSSFEKASRKMKLFYEEWLNACDATYSDVNDHDGHICYKDDNTMYEIEYRVIELTEEES